MGVALVIMHPPAPPSACRRVGLYLRRTVVVVGVPVAMDIRSIMIFLCPALLATSYPSSLSHHNFPSA